MIRIVETATGRELQPISIEFSKDGEIERIQAWVFENGEVIGTVAINDFEKYELVGEVKIDLKLKTR